MDAIIDGYIVDSDENPIYNAEIYIKELSTGVVSDISGYFQITIPDSISAQKDYTIIISHIGYETRKVNSSLLYSKPSITLNKELINAEKIFVTALGYNSYVKDSPVVTHVITAKDIYDSPYSSASDIIEFVIPNVQRVHDPHGTDDKLKIQGLDSRFLVFMIDGNRISCEFAGNIDLSIINVDDIERIEVIRSGMSTLYGSDSMGGLINIITKKNNKALAANIIYNQDLPSNESLSLGFRAKLYDLNYKLNLSYNHSPGYDLTPITSELNKTVEENLNYKINNFISYKWFSE